MNLRLTNEEYYWVWLSSIDGMGPVTFYNILQVFLDAKTACENVPEIHRHIRLPQKLQNNLRRDMNARYIDRLLKKIEKNSLCVLTRLNQDYPKQLAEIDNPPPVLYFKGMIPDVDTRSCGIVGTRRPTRDGADTAQAMAYDLAMQGIPIISGMARGVDTAAHIGAMEASGQTIAVLGSGVNVVYPPENRKVYDQITENGAVVSEFIPDTEPKPGNFPMRNRVIAGLSHSLIAGEGGIKSGARITVDCALQQGKNVYVLPCNLGSTVAELPNYLIESGAPVAKSAKNIMADQGWSLVRDVETKTEDKSQLSDDQQMIYAILSREELTTDELCSQTTIGIQDMNMLLTVMELAGWVEAVPGGKYRVNK